MKFLAAKHVRDIWYVLYSHKFLKMARIIKEKNYFRFHIICITSKTDI